MVSKDSMVNKGPHGRASLDSRDNQDIHGRNGPVHKVPDLDPDPDPEDLEDLEDLEAHKELPQYRHPHSFLSSRRLHFMPLTLERSEAVCFVTRMSG